MIKKTLYFGNPAYLSVKNVQLVIKLPEVEKNDTLSESFKAESVRTIPIEDIGVVVIDNSQITITSGVMEALLCNSCALITCDSRRMPSGLMLPLESNTTQSERFTAQIEASLPLKKQLWQQTVQAKIENQAYILKYFHDIETQNMLQWANNVKSGDSDNMESRAAAFYWRNLFKPSTLQPIENHNSHSEKKVPFKNFVEIKGFIRLKDGFPPNNLLNYGYAILRAIIARALVISGLLPTLGIHHHNRYNAYCLADDIMEPYRPFVDKLVVEIINKVSDFSVLTKEIKSELLQIPVMDVVINGQHSPLMIAAGQTTASLAKCYLGELRKISYPVFK